MKIIQSGHTFSGYKSHYSTQLSFKSNREHEEMLRALNAARIKEKYSHVNELLNYEIHDTGCQDIAQFMLNFCCSITNDSEHSLEEFFASDTKAKTLRENMSLECQKNSLEMRQEIQNIPVFKDPVLALISANEMKEFIPDKSILQDSMYKETVDATKESYINAINSSSTEKFNQNEKSLIQEMTNIIKTTDGIDFGEEFDEKLATLVDLLKARKQNNQKVYNIQKIFVPKNINKSSI